MERLKSESGNTITDTGINLMVKRREPPTPKPDIPDDKIEAFAAGADGLTPPTSGLSEASTAHIMTRTTISIPQDLLIKVEDQAVLNKRSGVPEKSVSAIVRKGIELYFKANT